MRIAIIGSPGSGKTTQAELLSKQLKLPVISLGEMLRERDDPRIKKGELVPDEVALELLRQRLTQGDVAPGFILDGAPRTVEAAREMVKLSPLDRVFHLTAPEVTATERLMRRGREDDRPELIRRRFEIYREKIKPILDLYHGMGVLVEIDASSPAPLEIHRLMVSRLR